MDITERLVPLAPSAQLASPLPKLTVPVGEALILRAPYHESVGFTSECLIADPTVLSLEDDSIRYLHPERLGGGITGGDEAVQTYCLRALKPGESLLTLRRLFRGEIEEEKAIGMVVQ